MNLSLVSQKPLAANAQGVLAALRASNGFDHYFNEVRVAQPGQWQPGAQEVAILLLEEGDAAWPAFSWPGDNGGGLGLPVLPLLVHKQSDGTTLAGPDVRDPHLYFVSNGIVLDEAELADPACSRVLQSKLESYFPLLSRLTLLRQRQPQGLCN
ncbi:MAG: hypothetical protein ACRCYW_01785 [Aeromonas sp.]|uniref:hypothetical protein n=1 Tax=Aeromonas sp. TaxID=647 RepID=UPI003F32703C